MGAWIQTKRTQFDLEDPQPDMVFIEDIAEALSKLCRFSGHCSTFYSVAEHSVRVCYGELNDANESVAWFERHGLEGLLHDAAEAYIGDITSPIKGLIPEIAVIERRIDAAIRERFGLPAEMSSAVAAADIRALAGEARQLFRGQHGMQWPQLEGFAWSTVVVRSHPTMSPMEAERLFYICFECLFRGVCLPTQLPVEAQKGRRQSSRLESR